jgi:predicted oxidoreductase
MPAARDLFAPFQRKDPKRRRLSLGRDQRDLARLDYFSPAAMDFVRDPSGSSSLSAHT